MILLTKVVNRLDYKQEGKVGCGGLSLPCAVARLTVDSWYRLWDVCPVLSPISLPGDTFQTPVESDTLLASVFLSFGFP